MNGTMDFKEFIWELSRELYACERKMTVSALAERLNAAGFRTRYGHEYQGLRGTYRLVLLTYRWRSLLAGVDSAVAVAESFVGPSGEVVWER